MSAGAKLNEEMLIEQFKSVIIVSQGDAVTKGKPDKDKESITYSNILSTLANGVERFNYVYKVVVENEERERENEEREEERERLVQ
jgi:hypothetical protein